MKIFFLRTLGHSMWPLVPGGSRLTVGSVPQSSRPTVGASLEKNLPKTESVPQTLPCRPSDSCVFRHGRLLVCHRLIRVRLGDGGRELLMKGDALFFVDGWIPESQVVGRVLAVDGKAVGSTGFRTASSLMYWHSRIQVTVFELLFLSAFGKHGKKIRDKFTRVPIFLKAFQSVSAPWRFWVPR